MKAHIRYIAVFNENGARYLPEKGELKPGLNIITGQSKTGKSALFDIIDWCLGNTTFVVPKGKITDFAKIYAILIKFNNQSVLIARQGEYEGKKQMYVKSFPETLEFKKINFAYFKENEFIGANLALKEIEKYLDFKEEPEFDHHRENKPSIIRSIIPFILQIQDTIKDKRNLFYPSPTKNHFPILSGWITQKYYDLQEQLKYYEKKIKSYGNIQEKQDERNRVIFNFYNAFEDYYIKSKGDL